ncbi:hypothetical protein HanIR_Chr02g0067191 [Helianthus annuus]|nr:hypothetical protein HanIR_Chr02g0067191 [Helianthus annuus]
MPMKTSLERRNIHVASNEFLFCEEYPESTNHRSLSVRVCSVGVARGVSVVQGAVRICLPDPR